MSASLHLSDSLQPLADLKRKITAARAKTDRAAGVLDQLLSTLKEEWGCLTIEEAKEKFRVMTKKAERLSSEFKEASRKFEEAWGDELSKLS